MTNNNWNSIVKEYEPYFNHIYRYDHDGEEYRFFGLIHAEDDYYYGMVNKKTGKLIALSCVCSLETGGFKKIPNTNINICNNCFKSGTAHLVKLGFEIIGVEWIVNCSKCHRDGKAGKTELEAIAKWNAKNPP